jgi:hypothetical protein
MTFSQHRGRSPQPPAEEDEDDFDDTLVAIDTCESSKCPPDGAFQSVLGGSVLNFSRIPAWYHLELLLVQRGDQHSSGVETED